MPHVKYDKFEKECREKFLSMNRSVELASCPCRDLPWPSSQTRKKLSATGLTYTNTSESGRKKRTFRGVVMGSLSADPLKPSLRSAESEARKLSLQGDQEIIQSVYERMKNVTDYLYTGLEEVYSCEDKKMLGNIRTVLDIERLLQLTKEMSPAVVVQREVSKFITAAEVIDQDFDVKYEKSEMRIQYRNFVESISEIGEQENSENLTSIEIVVMMMNTEQKRWRGCEAAMDIVCQAATMKTVESVVESWVSVLEHHSSKSRSLKAETIQREMMISENGPQVQHSQTVVEESMKLYWSKLSTSNLKQGHFTRRSEKVKSYFVSKSVDSLNSVPIKTPFIL